jgi:hypothetical protein
MNDKTESLRFWHGGLEGWIYRGGEIVVWANLTMHGPSTTGDLRTAINRALESAGLPLMPEKPQ